MIRLHVLLSVTMLQSQELAGQRRDARTRGGKDRNKQRFSCQIAEYLEGKSDFSC